MRRARHSTNDLYQLPLKWKKLSTCHCEGALRPWQSREGTCSLYKLLLKRCAPIASVAALSERHAGQQHVAHGFCGVTPPELSLRGRFAPVAISQYLAGLWESCRRNRNCLHEIATSASGLLAMTIWGQFHFNDALCQSAAPRRAGLSPTLQHIFGSLTKSPPAGPLPAGPRCGRGGRYYAGPRRGHRPSCRSGRGR